ncbi:MAG: S41 family peptidase [Phycisphaerales bacterium JB064]
MRASLAAAIALILLFCTASAQARQTAGGVERERSPFTDVRFEGERAHVLVRGQWYEWLEIDGVPYDAILHVARQRFPDRWQKRIAEDLLVLLDAVGQQPGDTVRLKLRSLEHDTVQLLPAVAMTNENRNRVRDARRQRESDSPIDAAAVFAEIVKAIRDHHAYADLKSLDLDALALEATHELGDAPTRSKAILAAQRLIARLGDGHARVDGWELHTPRGTLDVLLQHAQGGVVAFRRGPDAKQGNLLDADRPYVVSIDGVPIETWIEAASAYVVDGSPALVRERSTRTLRYANLIRDRLDLPHKPTATIRVRSADGTSSKELELPVGNDFQVYGDWPRTTSRTLDSGFGYIRLHTMVLDATALKDLKNTLDSMAETPGLIIDVRGNGGGYRDAINAVAPRFLDPDQPEAARVVNVARARLATADDPANPDGYLGNRHAFPANWPGWSPIERTEIERFNQQFKPRWQPARGRFSDPHYMVVSREAGGPIYGKPVVVLMDEGCFSATDIFLGAMKGLPNVTLMGTPSSGGSANSDGYVIESLGVEIRLATMVSYATDGRLYDGNGITPDIHVPCIATDLIGQTDTQLDAAIEHLRAQQSK